VLQDSVRLISNALRDEPMSRMPRASQVSRKPADTDQIFDALGLPVRRAMVRRLREGGAMSLSKLAKPYKISLPAALKHVRVLEESGVITTEKQGRVRICVYSPHAFKELASTLASQTAFWEGSFARLEGHIKNKQKKA
jgi:DNA-binding transcriptional ArsR family regulator